MKNRLDFPEYLEVVWPPKSVLPPRYEVHCFVATIGMAAVLVPLVAFTAAFRTGNMANDSDKLGNLLDVRRRRLSSCWTHGPPSSSTLHSFTALALLVVKLMIEARLVQAGLMSTGKWQHALCWTILIYELFYLELFWEAMTLPKISIISKFIRLGGIVSKIQVYKNHNFGYSLVDWLFDKNVDYFQLFT